MHLTTNTGIRIEEPSAEQLRQSLLDLADSSNGFVRVARASGSTFAQVTKDGDGGFGVELRDMSTPGECKIAEGLGTEEAFAALVLFGAGDMTSFVAPEWKVRSDPPATTSPARLGSWLDAPFDPMVDGPVGVIAGIISAGMFLAFLVYQPVLFPWPLPLWVIGALVGAAPWLSTEIRGGLLPARAAGIAFFTLPPVALLILGLGILVGFDTWFVVYVLVGYVSGMVLMLAASPWRKFYRGGKPE